MEKEIKWEKGDVAICVNTDKLYGHSSGALPQLRLNVEYIVSAVRMCECGRISLDVGLYHAGESGTKCICGALSTPGTHIHWAHAERFVKKKSKEAVQEEIDMAIHDEDYELAHRLQEQLNTR